MTTEEQEQHEVSALAQAQAYYDTSYPMTCLTRGPVPREQNKPRRTRRRAEVEAPPVVEQDVTQESGIEIPESTDGETDGAVRDE